MKKIIFQSSLPNEDEDRQEKMRIYYDTSSYYEENLKQSFTGKESRFKQYLIKNVFQIYYPRINEKILDVGCGLGHFCRYLIAKNPHIWKVTGMDFSGYAIEKASRNKIGESYVVGTAYKMPFIDNSFDAISAQEIIEHLSDTEAFLKECIRVLKSNGKLFITTPDARESKSIEKDHIREFEIKELNDILSKYGKVSVALSSTIIDRVTKESFTDNFVLYMLEVK